MSFSAITLFCDDIREEKSGAITLVGVLVDNLQVPRLPAALPKLGTYTRIILPIDDSVEPLSVVLKEPKGAERDIGTFDLTALKKLLAQGKAQGAAHIGLLASSMISPFPIRAAGRFVAVVRRGSTEQFSGQLNFVTPD